MLFSFFSAIQKIVSSCFTLLFFSFLRDASARDISIRSTSCSCSTCCFGSLFQHQNQQDFIKTIRALITHIFLGTVGAVGL